MVLQLFTSPERDSETDPLFENGNPPDTQVEIWFQPLKKSK